VDVDVAVAVDWVLAIGHWIPGGIGDVAWTLGGGRQMSSADKAANCT